MASPIVRGQNFSTTELVNATKLQNIVDNSTFKANNGSTQAFSVSGTTDIGTCVKDGGLQVHTTGQLQVEDLKIATGKLANNAVETAKIADSSSKTTGVTFAKMQHISTAKVLGRVSASEGDVEEAFDFKDQDDMSSNSATALASQQSIKAYVDGKGIIQTALASTTTQVATTDSIPYDDSAPLITEGVPTGLSVAMTPTSTGNTIRATLDGYFRNSSAAKFVIISLFEGNTCVGVSQLQQPSNGNAPGTMTYYFNAASASEHTYTVRFGAHSGGTATMDTTPTFGGLSRTTLFLEEIS
jgi:hypothetical protein